MQLPAIEGVQIRLESHRDYFELNGRIVTLKLDNLSKFIEEECGRTKTITLTIKATSEALNISNIRKISISIQK